MKKRLIYLLVFVNFVFFLSFASASFKIGNQSYSIEKTYALGDSVRGWVNLSFDKEDGGKLFSDSFGNNVKLIDLLNTDKNSGLDFLCSPIDCGKDYSTSSGETTKTFNLGVGESKLIGLKLSGIINTVSSVNFQIESDAVPSCSNQLKGDIFNDENFDFGNTKASNDGCSSSEGKGCFNSSKTTTEYITGTSPNKHCQKINLTESPGFLLGAWIKEVSKGSRVTIGIYDSGLTLVKDIVTGKSASCDISLTDISSAGGEVYCSVDYYNPYQQEYYVCIYSEGGQYKVRGYEDQLKGCGFYGSYIKPLIAGFDIFAEGRKFDTVGLLNVTNALSSGDTISGLISDYILNRYENCSNGCVIPIRFYSSKDQTVTLKNLSIEYETPLGKSTENRFYEVEEKDPIISMNKFDKIYLDEGNFTLPNQAGNKTFELSFDGNKIFSEKISIQEGPIIKSLSPLTTISAFPTKFRVNANSTKEITKYTWDFGNDNTQITTNNTITYTYNATGNYTLTISVEDSIGIKASKTFGISVKSPKDLIDSIINKSQDNLQNINTQISGFPKFYQDQINSELDVNSMNEGLKEVQREYESAVSEEDYNNIAIKLLGLNIPISIFQSKTADSFPFFPQKEDISIQVLGGIDDKSYESKDESLYQDAAIAWEIANTKSTMKFTEISAEYEGFQEKILTVVEMNIQNENSTDTYFVIKNLDNLKFDSSHSATEKDGYAYLKLKGSEDKIIFSTTEDIGIESIPVFISPGISQLNIIDLSTVEPAGKLPFKWTLFIALLGGLIFVSVIVYIILYQWYKYKYENYLFKDRNYLYNLIVFIQDSQKKGLSNKEIEEKLKKAKWNSEQINYVMRKYAGKRTGMPEIPIWKIFSIFKRKRNDAQLPLGVIPTPNRAGEIRDYGVGKRY
jgi:PKD repeat protein